MAAFVKCRLAAKRKSPTPPTDTDLGLQGTTMSEVVSNIATSIIVIIIGPNNNNNSGLLPVLVGFLLNYALSIRANLIMFQM